MLQMPFMYDTDAVDVCYRCRLCMIQMPLIYATDAVYGRHSCCLCMIQMPLMYDRWYRGRLWMIQMSLCRLWMIQMPFMEDTDADYGWYRCRLWMVKNEMNEILGHLLCTYRLNRARRTSWALALQHRWPALSCAEVSPAVYMFACTINRGDLSSVDLVYGWKVKGEISMYAVILL